MCIDPTAGSVLNSRLEELMVSEGTGVLWFEWAFAGWIEKSEIELVPHPSAEIEGDLLEGLYSEVCIQSRKSCS